MGLGLVSLSLVFGIILFWTTEVSSLQSHNTTNNNAQLSQQQATKNITMRAAGYTDGGPENLHIQEIPVPEPQENEVRIQIFATAINRADTLQRAGKYNPPPGVTRVLGLEAVGVVDKVGEGCPSTVKEGQRVMALLAGGGNAEYVTCRHEQVMPVPKGMSFVDAAAIPEVWLTAFQLLYTVGQLSKQDKVLIHAGGSGVGTAAVQLVRQAGATAIVTAGSQEKIDLALSLGAKVGVNYKEGGVAEKVLKATNGEGVDLILDCVGKSMFDENISAIRLDGRWIMYGFLGGSQIDTNLGLFLRKRVNLHFTTLRMRSLQYKEKLVQSFSQLAVPLFESGAFKPITHSVLSLEEIADAHRLMESNANLGKIVLKVRDEPKAEKMEL